MRILGIDPGFRIVGIVLLDYTDKVNEIIPLGKKLLKFGRKERLAILYKYLQDIAAQYEPDFASVEQVFFARNFNSALKLAKISGVIESSLYDICPIYDYATRSIKKSITLSGSATKDDLKCAIENSFNVSTSHLTVDEVDALGAALTLVNELHENNNI